MLAPFVYTSKFISCLRAETFGPADKWAIGLGQLSDAVNRARYTYRFWGGIRQLETFVEGRTSKEPEPKLVWVRQAQNLLGLTFNPCDILNFIGTVAPGLYSQGDLMGRTACKIWFSMVMLDVYALYVQTFCPTKTNSTDGSSKACTAKKSECLNRLVTLVGLICDAFMAFNWSLKDEFLNNKQVALFGAISSLINLSRGFQTKYSANCQK